MSGRWSSRASWTLWMVETMDLLHPGIDLGHRTAIPLLTACAEKPLTALLARGRQGQLQRKDGQAFAVQGPFGIAGIVR